MSTTAQNLIFASLLATAAERQASDVHLVPGEKPMLRVDGALERLEEEAVVTAEALTELVGSLLAPEESQQLARDRQIIIAKSFERGLRFKINVHYQRDQLSLSLRTIRAVVPSLAELGLPEFIQSYAQVKRGLVIVAGPFDSGKTTTIASFLQTINASARQAIITFEAPIEYVLKSDQAMVEQREIGRDVPTLLDGLSVVEAEDVDVLAVADVPDSASREKLLRLTEAGRLTFLAVEANSTIQALEQMVQHPVPEQRQHLQSLLADVFLCLILQRLVRRVGGGRLLATELVIGTQAIQALIREGRFFQVPTLVQTSRADGMMPLDTALQRLVQSGEVLPEEALRHAQDRANMQRLLAK